MPAMAGSFSGSVKMQSTVALSDQSNHSLNLAETSGTQKSRDKNWNNSAITYWGITDLVGGEGSQTGYFVNAHGGGDRDWGTFEGRAAASGAEMTVEGTWQFTGGSGKFKGLTGGGTFKTTLGAAGAVEAAWQGSYDLAPAREKTR